MYGHYSSADFHLKQDDVHEQPKEEDLDKPINVYLSETDTIWLLDMPAAVISSDDPQAELTKYVPCM